MIKSEENNALDSKSADFFGSSSLKELIMVSSID